MHVLVVGGAGYIGAHVASVMLDAGHRVSVFDNLSSGLRENLFDEATFIEGDIRDAAAVGAACARDVDAIVHLAALKAAGDSMVDPAAYADNNLGGTVSLLGAALAGGVRFVVFSSSAAVYGEPEYLPVDEAHPTQPTNFYGFTKLAIEQLLGWYDQLKGMRFASLRYFNAAGYDPAGRVRGLERGPQNLLPIVMEVVSGQREALQIFGDDYDTPDGTGVRDYIHVSDLAVAHRQALDWIEAEGRSLTVNLGSETGISVNEIVEAARRLTGQAIPATVVGRRAGDPARLVATAAHARELLGWAPRYSDLDSLVTTTWKAYQAHQD